MEASVSWDPEYDTYPDARVDASSVATRREQCTDDARFQLPAKTSTPPSPARVYRVAVASRNGRTVHEHFDKATIFRVIDIQDGVARFVANRANHPVRRAGVDHEDDQPTSPGSDIPESIADCCAVVVAAIGPGARERLKRANISIFVERAFIDEALARVAERLADKFRRAI